MDETTHSPKPDSLPDAPRRLREDLAVLYDAEVPVPEALDRVILEAAHRRLERRRPVVVRLAPWARVAAVAAAAAAVLLAVWVIRPAAQRPAEPPETPIAARRSDSGPEREDVDGNGRVDILDAFALARRVEAGAPPATQWDLNADGTVDRRDVDAVALAAVSLNRSPIQ